jgi:hypothetical protein
LRVPFGEGDGRFYMRLHLGGIGKLLRTYRLCPSGATGGEGQTRSTG